MSVPLPPNTHVCDYMRSSVAVLYDYLLGSGDEVPTLRKLSISKLAMLLRDEIDAAKRESPSFAAQQDQKFQALKAQLLKKPRKNSRLYKELNHG